jgi:hypothetical protein
MTGTLEQISGLLHEAGETHHRVFRIVDGTDDDWASWYAQWLIDLSELPDLLGTRPVRSELIYVLVGLDKQYTAEKPGETWELYYARQLLRHFQLPAGGEADVEAAQVGLQAGVLDRDEVGGSAGLVVVGVPHAGRGDEGAAGLPVHPDRVGDVAAVVQPGAEQRVAAGADVQDQVEGHGLVAVRPLFLPGRQQPEHRP